MAWLANLRGRMRSSIEKRRNSRQIDDTPILSTSPAISTTTSDQPAPPTNPLPSNSSPTTTAPAPMPSNPTLSSQPPAVQKPPLYHIPTDIITATEKGMIGGSLCATIPSSSSTASSQKHDSEARDVASTEGKANGAAGPVLTRAEEACSGEREGGRSVMFKGVDV